MSRKQQQHNATAHWMLQLRHTPRKATTTAAEAASAAEAEI